MSDDKSVAQGATAKAPRVAGPGEYFFEMIKVDAVLGGPDYSSAIGPAIVGDRMMTGLMRMPAGTGSDPHSHPNEQWIFVIEGNLEMNVGETSQVAAPGTVIYIPSDIVHNAKVHGDADVVFFTVKDTSHGLHGIKQG